MSDNLLVTDIQRFCMHDGEGLRTTVFLKGCPLHCKWCHNPETQRSAPEILFSQLKCIHCGACQAVCGSKAQIAVSSRKYIRENCIVCGKCAEVCPSKALSVSGRYLSVSDIINTVKKDLPFYGKDGGLTVSGGEPTFQKEGLLSLLQEAKAEGINVCIETCGAFSSDYAQRLYPLADLFLFDVKDTNEARLRENTGADLQSILSRLYELDSFGKKSVMRCIIIPEVNMNDEHLSNLADIFLSLRNCFCIELLPYHPYGASKSNQLGIVSPITYPKPAKEDILSFAEGLKSRGAKVKCFGSLV